LTLLERYWLWLWRQMTKTFATHSSSSRVLFMAIALPFLGLTTHYRESWLGAIFIKMIQAHTPICNFFVKLKCYYINIRSIVNKLPQYFAYSHNFDVIAITETWLSNSIYDKEILPMNYKIYRNDRGCRGGGVLLPVQDNIYLFFINFIYLFINAVQHKCWRSA